MFTAVFRASVSLSESGWSGEFAVGFWRADSVSFVAAAVKSRLDAVGILVLCGNQATVSVVLSALALGT